MKVVMTYGTFDLFHVGHIRLLKRLSQLGDKLIVGLSTDEFNSVKGKESFFSFDERKEILEATKYVDIVIPEENWEQKSTDVSKYNVDTFAIGDDWRGKFDYLKEQCEVVYLPRTDGISTTKIKSRLGQFNSKELVQLENKLHDVLDIVKVISSVNG